MKKAKKRGAPSITRRDFVGGTLIGSGAALLAAKAPGLISNADAAISSREFPQKIPISLNTLDKSWTGPGGIGDYATANGNTHAVVNAAHTFRSREFDAQIEALHQLV